MSTKSFYGMGQGSFYGGGMYGNGQPPVSFIEKELGPAPIVSFNDGLKNKPLKECVANIEPVQDLHGYDAPWPAGGGKNLFDIDTAYADTSKFTISGNKVTAKISDFAGTLINIPAELVGVQLTFSAKLNNVPESTSSVLTRAVVNGSNINGSRVNAGNTDFSFVTFTPTSTNDGVKFAYANSGTNSITIEDIQLEVGSSRTTYAPYSNICPITGRTGANIYVSPTDDPADGRTYSVAFPTEAGTVYGGTLDVTSGVLTVTHTKKQITKVTHSTATSYAMTQIGDFGDIAAGEKMCNVLAVYGGSANSMTKGHCLLLNSEGYNRAQVDYWFPGMTGTTITARKASAQAILDELVQAGTPMEVVFPLSNPIVYQLTPQQITTLLGTNNMWADTGDITIKYLAKK